MGWYKSTRSPPEPGARVRPDPARPACSLVQVGHLTVARADHDFAVGVFLVGDVEVSPPACSKCLSMAGRPTTRWRNPVLAPHAPRSRACPPHSAPPSTATTRYSGLDSVPHGSGPSRVAPGPHHQQLRGGSRRFALVKGQLPSYYRVAVKAGLDTNDRDAAGSVYGALRRTRPIPRSWTNPLGHHARPIFRLDGEHSPTLDRTKRVTDAVA